jgi:hypothetical protein
MHVERWCRTLGSECLSVPRVVNWVPSLSGDFLTRTCAVSRVVGASVEGRLSKSCQHVTLNLFVGMHGSDRLPCKLYPLPTHVNSVFLVVVHARTARDACDATLNDLRQPRNSERFASTMQLWTICVNHATLNDLRKPRNSERFASTAQL